MAEFLLPIPFLILIWTQSHSAGLLGHLGRLRTVGGTGLHPLDSLPATLVPLLGLVLDRARLLALRCGGRRESIPARAGQTLFGVRNAAGARRAAAVGTCTAVPAPRSRLRPSSVPTGCPSGFRDAPSSARRFRPRTRPSYPDVGAQQPTGDLDRAAVVAFSLAQLLAHYRHRRLQQRQWCGPPRVGVGHRLWSSPRARPGRAPLFAAVAAHCSGCRVGVVRAAGAAVRTGCRPGRARSRLPRPRRPSRCARAAAPASPAASIRGSPCRASSRGTTARRWRPCRGRGRS